MLAIYKDHSYYLQRQTFVFDMTKAGPDAAQCATRLRRAVLVLARRLRPSLQGDGISAAKLSVIGQLYRAGPMTPTELAVREGVKLPSLTRLLAELESDGWLTREAHASDGRRSLLRLTAHGRKRLVAAAQAADAPLAGAIAATISVDDRRVLLQACALLERIDETLSGHAKNVSHTPL
jgi:DNA-binding MarR family transcriptional regulator